MTTNYISQPATELEAVFVEFKLYFTSSLAMFVLYYTGGKFHSLECSSLVNLWVQNLRSSTSLPPPPPFSFEFFLLFYFLGFIFPLLSSLFPILSFASLSSFSFFLFSFFLHFFCFTFHFIFTFTRILLIFQTV